MSTEFIALLCFLAVGIIVSTFLLLKIVIEVKKTRKEFREIRKEQVKQFQKEFMEKRATKKSDE